jgi:hypothetical protein
MSLAIKLLTSVVLLAAPEQTLGSDTSPAALPLIVVEASDDESQIVKIVYGDPLGP